MKEKNLVFFNKGEARCSSLNLKEKISKIGDKIREFEINSIPYTRSQYNQNKIMERINGKSEKKSGFFQIKNINLFRLLPVTSLLIISIIISIIYVNKVQENIFSEKNNLCTIVMGELFYETNIENEYIFYPEDSEYFYLNVLSKDVNFYSNGINKEDIDFSVIILGDVSGINW